MTSWGLLAVLVLWAGLVAMRRARQRTGQMPRLHRDAKPAQGRDPDIDYQELEQAEREISDFETDAKGRPLDDVIGDDWGPGTPKPPYT